MLRKRRRKTQQFNPFRSELPSCAVKIAAKSYLLEYVTPQFRKCGRRRENTWEHVVPFFDSMGAQPNDADIGLRKYSKSLTIRAYTWYVNMKPRSVHYWEYLLSLFNMKVFFVKANFYWQNQARCANIQFGCLCEEVLKGSSGLLLSSC